ncbi:MAG: hypothetical protein AB4911_13190 [Oscillochloridaceae bacterium umkhey_bin13]
MASSASQRSIARARGAGSALSLPRIGDLRPYLFLALLTALVLTAAYTVRPTVRIDLGGARDAAFLNNFNGREIDAVTTPERFAWASDAATLDVPGNRLHEHVAIFHATPGLPPNTLRGAAVALNGVRLEMPRRTPDSIIARVPPELAAAPTLSFSIVSPLVGDPTPPLGLVSEIELARARTYRWSREVSTISLPNLGRGTWLVELGTVVRHPDGQPVQAQLLAGGVPLVALPESDAPRRIRLLVPPSAIRDGSLNLELRSNVFLDPRPLGVLVSDVLVAPAVGESPLTAVPPFGSLGMAVVAVLGAFASLQILLGTPNQRGNERIPPYLWAALGVAVAALVGGWAIGAHRFPSNFMLPRVAWLGVGSIVLALALRPLTQWLFRAGGAPLDQAVPDVGGARFLRLLLIIFLVSFWLKALGVIFPYFVAIDVNWHMTRSQWIINGDLPRLYGTNSPLNETTMPTAEWGENRPVIPYSPWFHIFATSFALVPFMSMDMAANLASLLIDSSRILLIALIAVRAGLTGRGALLAGATYAVLPVAFLLHAWGNLPTAFGLWMTLLCTTLILCRWEDLHQRPIMVTLSVLLLITFLIYTVTGVFMGVFLIALTVLLWLNSRRGGVWAALMPPVRPLWIAAGVAIALAIIIYYGQYLPPIFVQTVPYLSTVFTQGPQSVGVERPSFSEYAWSFVPHLDYRIWPGDFLYFGLAIPLIFTLPGFWALRNQPLPWITFAAWGSVALLFFLAGYRISMVDKQLFYLLPVICICWAVYADRIWTRWGWGRWVVIAVLLYSLYAALDQWLMRIAISPVLD